MSEAKVKTKKLDRRDFVSDQAVRWCPGCGDYAILAQTQKVFPDFVLKILFFGNMFYYYVRFFRRGV